MTQTMTTAEATVASLAAHGIETLYGHLEETLVTEGQTVHRFSFHDRKAWWQQEQAVLAYLILAGSLGNPEHLRLARESAAFYNAMFLDHDEGGVYFNVLASGLPYLVGNERLKATKMGRDWIVTRRALRDYMDNRAPQGRRAKREKG